jgi:hypothetical protein
MALRTYPAIVACDGALDFENITPVDMDISRKGPGNTSGSSNNNNAPRWTCMQARSGKSGIVPVI